MLAVMRLEVRHPLRVEADEARGAVDARGRLLEVFRLGAERGAFVQDRVDTGLGQLDVRGLARGREEPGAVIGVDRQAQLVIGDRLPMGAAVAPELALGMDDAPEAFGQILAHALRDISTSEPMKSRFRSVSASSALKRSAACDAVAHGRLALADQHIVEVLLLGRGGDQHGHAALRELARGAGHLALGLAAGQVAVAGDDDRGVLGDRRAADVRDAEAGPGLLSGRLPDRERGLDALAEDQRFPTGETHRGLRGPAIDGLVGALDHLDRGLPPLGRQIDLLDRQHLARLVGGERDHGAELAEGILAIADAVGRRGGDPAVAQVGEDRRARRGSRCGARSRPPSRRVPRASAPWAWPSPRRNARAPRAALPSRTDRRRVRPATTAPSPTRPCRPARGDSRSVPAPRPRRRARGRTSGPCSRRRFPRRRCPWCRSAGSARWKAPGSARPAARGPGPRCGPPACRPAGRRTCGWRHGRGSRVACR